MFVQYYTFLDEYQMHSNKKRLIRNLFLANHYVRRRLLPTTLHIQDSCLEIAP